MDLHRPRLPQPRQASSLTTTAAFFFHSKHLLTSSLHATTCLTTTVASVNAVGIGRTPGGVDAWVAGLGQGGVEVLKELGFECFFGFVKEVNLGGKCHAVFFGEGFANCRCGQGQVLL